MNVFIVDDSVLFRERLKDMILEIPEVKVAGEAANAADAIEAIQRLKPDVVIADINMPGGSGTKVIKNVKTIHSSPVVIVMTDYPYVQYRKKCTELGVDYFFEKSDEYEKVTDVIRRLSGI